MRQTLKIIAYAITFLMLTACNATKGSIIIKENIYGTACEIKFTEWNEKNKCEMSLKRNDELRIEIICESGSVAIDVSGKKGDRAYTGNSLDNCSFTVTVSDDDEYVISIKGDDASGSINIRNISGKY